MEISGYCEEKFGEVKKAFEKNLNSGKECGASFSVTIEGKTVIDLWGVCRCSKNETMAKRYDCKCLFIIQSCDCNLCVDARRQKNY